MTKTIALNYLNSRLEIDRLNTRNTTFANISISSIISGWWMNIKLDNLKKDWNVVLVGQKNLFWLKIPANTFANPEKYFRIWKSKNAVDLLISSEHNERYFNDISSGGSGVDFKPFIVEKFLIPEELKTLSKNKKAKSSRTKLKGPDFQKQQIIHQDQMNITYEKLFAQFLKGANSIKLQDPWIRLPYQFDNLLEFCVMLGNNNESGKTINFKVISWNTKNFQNQSIEGFEEIAAEVKEMGIVLTFILENHHDRYIEANNGWKIILGRGLDIFEKRESRFSIGDVDQRWRKCKACEITYLLQNQV